MDISNYNKFLLSILNNEENIDYSIYSKDIQYNLYITLLYLNNFKYHSDIELAKHNKVDNFLRKLNNLKVKIQLKRKETEITSLKDELLTIYKDNLKLINKYNLDNLNIEDHLNNLDSKELTFLIDKLTKTKMEAADSEEENSLTREKIAKALENNIKIDIELTKFISLYEYLLDIDSYDQILLNPHTNRLRILLINDLINIINNNDYANLSNSIIPVVLTYLLNKDINYNTIDTSNFNIDNIKIQDLYSNTEKDNPTNHAKWHNITLNNNYLFTEINKIVRAGTYYFEEDKFILEDLINNQENFKVSIDILNMKKLLIAILNTIN